MGRVVDPLEGLDPLQIDAVIAPDDVPVLVLAGPGSGKTRVISHRAVFLVDNLSYEPSSLVVTTFTRRAAEELRKRIRDVLGSRVARDINASTIHALCLRILRKEGYQHSIAESYHLKRILQSIMDASPHYTPIIKMQTGGIGWGFVYSWIGAAKQAGIQAPESKEWFESRILLNPFVGSPSVAQELSPWLADCYQKLETEMAEEGIMDFADMLRWTAAELRKPEVLARWREIFKYVLTDEVQDVSRLQFEILEALGGQHIFAVGDEWQSIYGWRGASRSNIIGFMARHPDGLVLPLELNYRSTKVIVSTANSLVKRDSQPESPGTTSWVAKTIRPREDAPDGVRVELSKFLNEDQEASYVADSIESYLKDGRSPKDIFVVYRTNAQSRPLEEELLEAGIPHVVSSGVGFWLRAHVQDILSYLWMSEKPNDQAFRRIYNWGSADHPTRTRFLGHVFLDACLQRGPTLWEGMQAVLRDRPEGSGRWISGIKDFMGMVEEITEGLTPEDQISIASSHYSSFFQRDEGVNPEDDSLSETLASVRSVARRYNTLRQFLNYTRKMQEVQRKKSTKIGDAVYLTTVHKVKGLEAPIVFGIGMSDSVLPHWASGGEMPILFDDKRARLNPWLPSPLPTNVEDERCVAYVLITRPIERLHLTWSESQGGKIKLNPSRFLEEMGLEPAALLAKDEDAEEGFNVGGG